MSQEAEPGSPGRPTTTGTRSPENSSSSPGTSGGLAEAGDEGPDLTEDDEETAADR